MTGYVLVVLRSVNRSVPKAHAIHHLCSSCCSPLYSNEISKEGPSLQREREIVLGFYAFLFLIFLTESLILRRQRHRSNTFTPLGISYAVPPHITINSKHLWPCTTALKRSLINTSKPFQRQNFQLSDITEEVKAMKREHSHQTSLSIDHSYRDQSPGSLKNC